MQLDFKQAFDKQTTYTVKKYVTTVQYFFSDLRIIKIYQKGKFTISNLSNTEHNIYSY